MQHTAKSMLLGITLTQVNPVLMYNTLVRAGCNSVIIQCTFCSLLWIVNKVKFLPYAFAWL